MVVLNLYISMICICFHRKVSCGGFRTSNFGFMQDVLYSSRECSTNQTFYAKQTQFSHIFHPKTKISPKNKPNSKPIQSQSKPKLTQKQASIMKTNPIKPNFRKAKTNAFSRKGSFTFVFTILQKFTLDWCLLVSLSGAKLITLKGANYAAVFLFFIHGHVSLCGQSLQPCRVETSGRII